MMKNQVFFLAIFCIALIMIQSCGKKSNPKTKYYTFSANPNYVGSHPTSSFAASAYLKEVSLDIEFQVDLQGASDTLEYTVGIYEYDSTATFKFNTTPTLLLGNYKGGIPLIKTLTSMDFTSFSNNYKGYLIVQDPLNKSYDTTTLLIFGKVGTEW